jgi:putative tryptophan/tyrosine transport system substrate-binding protein
MFDLRRRHFITLLASAAATRPLAARAQQPAMPVIGFLSSLARTDLTHVMPAFQEGLGRAGFIDGHNVAIEYRWADSDLSTATRSRCRSCHSKSGYNRCD